MSPTSTECKNLRQAFIVLPVLREFYVHFRKCHLFKKKTHHPEPTTTRVSLRYGTILYHIPTTIICTSRTTCSILFLPHMRLHLNDSSIIPLPSLDLFIFSSLSPTIFYACLTSITFTYSANSTGQFQMFLLDCAPNLLVVMDGSRERKTNARRSSLRQRPFLSSILMKPRRKRKIFRCFLNLLENFSELI